MPKSSEQQGAYADGSLRSVKIRLKVTSPEMTSKASSDPQSRAEGVKALKILGAEGSRIEMSDAT